MKELHCHMCGYLMAKLRDAAVRKDIVVFCSKCHESVARKPEPAPNESADMPEFLKGIFR